MQVDVFNTEKQKVGSVELPDDVFAAEVKEALLWEQVKAQLASRRRGTHSTKTRGAVSGGGIKPYRQKGTGRARQGSSRAPNHVGGGKVFGPHPRDYSYRLPTSSRRSALRSALSMRAKDGLWVLDKVTFEAPKTKHLVSVIEKFGGGSALFIDSDNENLKLSARNLPEAKYLVAEALNVYDILDHDRLFVTQAAIDVIVKRVRGAAKEAAASA